uniref:Ran gtpase-activating protein n=1 Tax=Gongylonema pulchrum TaxID=637853 RepID=A0A183EWS0_9BILA
LGSLEEIVMYQDGIKAEGIKALAECLRYNRNLRIINFNDNTFTESGAFAIAKALRRLKNIEVLDFGDCLCRNRGADAIIASLSASYHSRLTVHVCKLISFG